MFEELCKLFDTLAAIEALHAGAATPGERDAAASARERIIARLRQFEREDQPTEQKFTLVNQWSMRLFCALAKRYDLKPFRYYRQRYTTVMLKCPVKFVNEVLWPEFVALDDVLMRSLDEVTDKLIAESIFQGSTDVEIRDQALLECDTSTATSTGTAPKQEKASPSPNTGTLQTRPPNTQDSRLKAASSNKTPLVEEPAYVHESIRSTRVGRNDPCPCGSNKKFKKCCGG
jgi:hypothetical protein